ncbi:hemolysin family protein [Candidatus Gracilibacteria bacterium]|nr:hemolysin family protein [Candidatus Gracilibacteria bacterium]MCF7819687.1 hemolysin family protein [Candidatus Gracilibacteria bacterium]
MNDIFLLLLLLLLSGFFSGAEIALFSLGSEKIHALKRNAKNRKQKRRILRLELLKSSPNKLLVTILIGNNVVNIAASAMATLLAVEFTQQFGWEQNTSSVVGIVTGVMTFLILVFGEITPKSLAHRHALKFSLFSVPILNVLQFLLYPIIVPLAVLIKKVSGNRQIAQGMSEDELRAAIEISEREGKIESGEKELFEKVLEFDQHPVESIMTPRSKIFALPDDASLPQARKIMSGGRFSRTPIYHETLDQITGILTVHTLLEQVGKRGASKKKVANIPLLNPLKIPPTMKIDTLLQEFQQQKMHMGLVYDEHGGLIGLITMEDILEEIFGEIQDEQDEQEFSIQRAGKHSLICDSNTELEHIESFIRGKMELDIERFPWNVAEENNTLNYFLLEKLERFPQPNEKLEIQIENVLFVFTVQRVNGEKIESARVDIKI